MKKSTTKILISLLTMLPLAVHAQIIMCKDASGKTYTSDQPIMECANSSIREFGKNGTLKRIVPAPLTAEQARQKQLEEEKRKAEEVALADQKQADRAMLARYRNEGDIDVSRKRTLGLVEEQLKRQTGLLDAAEKQHQQVQSEIAKSKNTNNVPPVLQSRSDESGKTLLAEKKKFQDIEAEIVKINTQYDATLKRYRELNNRQSTASK